MEVLKQGRLGTPFGTTTSSALTLFSTVIFAVMILAPVGISAEEKTDLADSILYGDGQSKKNSGAEIYDNAFAEKSDDTSGISEERKDNPGKWEEEDINKIFPELKVLDELNAKKSLAKLQKVVRYYNYSVSRMRGASENIRLRQMEWASEKHKYPWRAMEREGQKRRVIHRIRAKYRQKAIGDLIKAMKIMGQIKNPALMESKQYIDLKAKIYIQFVKLQFRNKNLGICIPVLKSYLNLRPEHKNEAEPHRLLAASYHHQEKMAKRMRNSRSMHEYRELKNHHLKKFIDLKYDKSSPEYQRIQAQVSRDEIDNLR